MYQRIERLKGGFALSLSVLVIMAMVSCKEGSDVSQGTAWCMLLDISGVREMPQARENYAAYAADVISGLQPGDRCIVRLISDRSVSEGPHLISINLPVFAASSDNDMVIKAERERFEQEHSRMKDSISDIVVSYISNDPRVAPTTEIIGAIHRASGWFGKEPGLKARLVILSDMEEFSDAYDFTRMDLDDTRIAEVIQKERLGPAGLPALQGVQVSVFGASSKNQERYFKIRNFWKAYFKEAGAFMGEADYQ